MFKAPIFAALAAVFLPFATVHANANEAVSHFTLENGMDVVVVEDHRAPVVQQMVWYRAGSADEPKGASGVAHFLEHLLFKATDKMESGEFSATVAANGGRDNAFTSYDYTAYFQRVAADRLELMMRMESDRMRNIRLTPDNIRTERDVILEERNQRTENNPSALFNEQMNAAQYLNHRYGVPVIGWKHEMQTLDLDDALSFYETYYSPNNAILVVSGDVEPEDVLALAKKYYGVIPANPDLPERLRTEEPPQNAERRLIFRDPRVAQPYVSRSYLAPERDPGAQEKAAALTILAEILGGGTTSFLAEKMQFDTQVATYTAAYYRGSSLDDTTFNFIVVPADGVTLQQAEDALDAALADFVIAGVDAEQLDRIKLQIRASQIYARDDADSVANRYGQALAMGMSVQDVQDWPDILEAVTAQDIMQAASEVLDRRASVTGWLMKAEAAQ
ncbi:insulinase family protein [Sulfitobacter mediterraneus]|uniref:M16 family metallopeptidase n=1 Tax=Sulfitobacter mediterraneus TaxID=83219 RepID=UPI00193431EF|nr:pitrilysin family protein [Sulfitobacter mediterraneus]MBM1632634.1 insulinase family protein [Sulfitobacter mediterraneus]MBM1641232.1 insulinase family protein [Sulfitobacter mediterraneus]MBM1644499.1 insulinase family protein [Sulfitobacter mediterraneus]MBM1649352.1 insulinase family protein [Sulfitobacter mediterraneus]MBM1653373.1 insulinase family protein [Sulfitobacter mediterraneus]